ncbi:MAG: hypothetical protein OQL17_01260, partial [Sedimenticola sp.]|nr:hypothetical protein [Sedimenticola sp.]MCW8948580.1 hypothetical protein [Sedimenticola sp.]
LILTLAAITFISTHKCRHGTFSPSFTAVLKSLPISGSAFSSRYPENTGKNLKFVSFLEVSDELQLDHQTLNLMIYTWIFRQVAPDSRLQT